MKKEENELICLIRSNPDEGISQCIEKYGNGVKAICSNILRDGFRDFVEDAMAESYISLWQDVCGGKRIQNTLQGYLYGTARNQSLKILRDNRKHVDHICLEEGEGIEKLFCTEESNLERVFLKKQQEKLVHQVVRKLPEPDQTIFLLRYFYFYKVKEIAKQLDFTEDYVENRLRRGKKKLQKALEKRGMTYEDREE